MNLFQFLVLLFKKAGFLNKKPAWFLKKLTVKIQKMPFLASVFKKAGILMKNLPWFFKKRKFKVKNMAFSNRFFLRKFI